jgi:hypothetical protein
MYHYVLNNNIWPSIGYLLPQPDSVMYDYAVKNGYINNEEDYLLAMGDRQDLRMNLTKMTDEEFQNNVIENAQRCSDALNMGFNKDNLIKTLYFRVSKKSY